MSQRKHAPSNIAAHASGTRRLTNAVGVALAKWQGRHVESGGEGDGRTPISELLRALGAASSPSL